MGRFHLVGTGATRGLRGRVIGPHGTEKSGTLSKVDLGELSDHASAVDRTLARVAAELFAYEGIVRGRAGVYADSITIHVPLGAPLDSPGTLAALQQIVSFGLSSSPSISAARSREDFSSPTEYPKPRPVTIALFSGGTDSLAGLFASHQDIGPTAGLFVNHQPPLGHQVNRLISEALTPNGIKCFSVKIPKRTELQQLRGLLYVVCGGVAANIVGTDRIVIAESGPTTLLPEMAPLDTVTLTTHPYMLTRVRELLATVYGKRFHLLLPYGLMTKAESLASCQFKVPLRLTNSCRTTQFATIDQSHCGCCFGCIIRELSSIVANTPDAGYQYDPLRLPMDKSGVGRWAGKGVGPERMSDVLKTLEFARSILEDRLDASIRLKTDDPAVGDLYRRYAADILSGLHVIYSQKHEGHNQAVERVYTESIRDGVVKKGDLEERIQTVRSGKHRPDFTRELA
jgi:hypothetical protein